MAAADDLDLVDDVTRELAAVVNDAPLHVSLTALVELFGMLLICASSSPEDADRLFLGLADDVANAVREKWHDVKAQQAVERRRGAH